MELNQFLDLLSTPTFISLLVLMFSAFLIGYLAGLKLTVREKSKLISKLKNEVNSLKLTQKPVADIETIFTEIKPKIIEVVKNEQREHVTSVASQTKETIAEKTRSEYVNYTPGKPQLNFESFGYGHPSNKNRLTEINGIGPYIEEKLNEIGIYNFDQISRLQINDIRLITTLIDFFPGRIERDDWIGQAKALKAIHS
ncbi:hypothetical protein ULMS_18350 [Patiriisocius marinistellae]|uniref:Uncharacterized protein n=1 Tax=Patiriisocius marinistellae TaxID=2494560 RepID=A0A5J4FUL7_9FLAO|nr:hypothetical protein [Patiriisocius marinistellae]GEQ86327.1 hypothetical protein ULMS_18350 [Patiriisocius marinistellae]